MSAVERIRLDLPPQAHDYVVGDGAIDELGALSRCLPGVATDGPALIVTDPGVAATDLVARAEGALDASGYRSTVVVVPQGEDAKTLPSLERLWHQMGEIGLERGSPVFAVGGGAVGDLAGFAAASWMRGTPFVQVPTTLLAMTDSAVGGKTGINLGAGKNMVGAIHMPALIVADLSALDTRPDREIGSGLGEVVKCAVLSDHSQLETLASQADAFLSRDRAALGAALALAVGVKVEHVRTDAHETTGLRAMLNLGHTTAHALETASGLGVIPHGEAVAIGLVVAAELSARRGLCDRSLIDALEATLTALGLPTRLPSAADPSELVLTSRLDKKRRRGVRVMVLPRAVLGAELADVDDPEFLGALRSRM